MRFTQPSDHGIGKNFGQANRMGPRKCSISNTLDGSEDSVQWEEDNDKHDELVLNVLRQVAQT